MSLLQLMKNKMGSQRWAGVANIFVSRFAIFLLVCVATLSGAFEPLNMSLMDSRFRLLQRDPSDTLAVVVIDPVSLRKEDRWPWPRDRYAKVVANLQDAGVALVAFDVDFSALSDAEGDAAFVESLANRPGEVVLPIFSQWSSRTATDGELIQTPPHPYFLDDAVMASVNLTTEKNGLVRQGWLAFDSDDGIRPSIAAVLAEYQINRQERFYLDYGINPAKIKQLSFADVLSGDFDKDAVRGKKILIGATALELGDEFAAPVWGVTPGVMFHAVSYESMYQQRNILRLHSSVPLFIALFIILWLCDNRKYTNFRKAALYHLALTTSLIGFPLLAQFFTPVSIDVGAILAAQGFCIIFAASSSIRLHARQVIQQRAATARYQKLTGLVVQDNNDGVIVANAIGVVELCNDRAKRLLDAEALSPGENILDYAEDFPLLTVVNAPNADGNGVVENKKFDTSEFIQKKNSGLVLEVAASHSSLTNEIGDETGKSKIAEYVVYTLRDISARKRIEAAEREAKEAAIAANKMKSELISNMSHELRTPLNGVIGFADILQKEAFGPIGVPEYIEYSENIYTSGKRLLNIVNDMLNIGRLDADSFELSKSTMDMDELIDHCLAAFEKRTMQDSKSIQVKILDDIPRVRFDLTVISEIFAHLLGNAVEFAKDKEDSFIGVRVKQSGFDLVFEFVDNGCGVSPEHLPKLSEAFYQADSSLNRQHEGAGLGLYLVSKFTALHSGTLELKSKEGSGFLARLKFSDVVVKAERKAA